jgi:tetratricopeptide (TPR) repeat protein
VRVLFLVLALAGLPLGAQNLVEQGFEHFYNLEYPQALLAFEKAAARDPADPDLHNHIAETLVFQEMLRNGALESELVSGTNSLLRRPKLDPSPASEKRFLEEVSRAMELADARLKQNPNDPAALYALGISYGIRSDYYWVVKKSWHDSLRDATTARRLHNKLADLQPDNVDARLVEGLHDYLVGCLPWHYRMLGFLVGIRGDKEKGTRIVQEVAQKGTVDRIEAQIFLCAIYRRENQAIRAVPIIQELMSRFPRNYILRLELSQMYSMAGDGIRGLEAAREVERMKAAHAPGYDLVTWERIYYQEGTIQFWYRDLDGALANLRKATGGAQELDLNSGSYAWLRLGQTCDMLQRRDEALQSYRKAIDFAPSGEAAVEARRFLATPYKR